MKNYVCHKCGWTGDETKIKVNHDWPNLLDCPKCKGLVWKIAYTAKVDPIIYGDFTKDYDEKDWILLMYACLDQAGIKVSQMIDIQNYIYQITGISDSYKWKGREVTGINVEDNNAQR